MIKIDVYGPSVAIVMVDPHLCGACVFLVIV